MNQKLLLLDALSRGVRGIDALAKEIRTVNPKSSYAILWTLKNEQLVTYTSYRSDLWDVAITDEGRKFLRLHRKYEARGYGSGRPYILRLKRKELESLARILDRLPFKEGDDEVVLPIEVLMQIQILKDMGYEED